MYREDGKLAARGRHVKHLPMGRAWDLTATPLVFPLASKLHMRQHEQWLRDPERTKVGNRADSVGVFGSLWHLAGGVFLEAIGRC